MEDEGMYHCSTFLAGYLWNGTSYEVFLTNITGKLTHDKLSMKHSLI